MRLPLALLAALLLPALPAAAQGEGPLLSVAPFAGPLVPGGEAHAAGLAIRLPCDASEGTAVRLALDDAPPAWLHAEIVPAEVRVGAEPCEEGRVFRSSLRVRATDEAPALRAHVLRVVATVAAPDAEPRVLVQDVAVQAGHVLRVSATTQTPFLRGKEGDVLTFPIGVVNLGNHHARLVVSVVDNAGNLNVLVPPPGLVESTLAGGATNATTLLLQVQIPPGASGSSTIRVRVEPVSPFDARLRGEPVELTLGVDGPQARLLPGPGFPGALLALALGALVVRRAVRAPR